MAERRMFSRRICSSGRFLKLPVASQVLYFHLGLQADDDGVVEAYSVVSSIGATEGDLNILIEKGFIVVLNEDLVSYIVDWNENNQIRPDRKTDSLYRDLLLQELPDAKLKEKRTRADVLRRNSAENQPMDDQWTTNGQPMDDQWTTNGPHRLGKDSIGKDSIGDISAASPSKTTRHKYGQYCNVLLSDDDMGKLMAEFPSDYLNRIERLSEYIASTGKRYKNHLATIRAWARKDKSDENSRASNRTEFIPTIQTNSKL